jgi:hypothetical protein
MPIPQETTLIDAITSRWDVTWGDSLIDPSAPRVPRTCHQRLADWWEWSVKERWLDFRWRLGDRLEALAWRVKP